MKLGQHVVLEEKRQVSHFQNSKALIKVLTAIFFRGIFTIPLSSGYILTWGIAYLGYKLLTLEWYTLVDRWSQSLLATVAGFVQIWFSYILTFFSILINNFSVMFDGLKPGSFDQYLYFYYQFIYVWSTPWRGLTFVPLVQDKFSLVTSAQCRARGRVSHFWNWAEQPRSSSNSKLLISLAPLLSLV